MALIAALLVDFFLKVVVGAHDLLEFATLAEERLLTGFKFMQQRSVVVVPTSREMILDNFIIQQFDFGVVLLYFAFDLAVQALQLLEPALFGVALLVAVHDLLCG
jgi:hypothetical protein